MLTNSHKMHTFPTYISDEVDLSVTSFSLNDLEQYTITPNTPVSFDCNLEVTLAGNTEWPMKSGFETQFSFRFILSKDQVFSPTEDAVFLGSTEPQILSLLQVRLQL